MQVKLAFTLKLTVTLLHHLSLQSAAGQYCCCNTPVLQYCQVIKDCSSLLLLVSCPSISCSFAHCCSFNLCCSSSSLPHQSSCSSIKVYMHTAAHQRSVHQHYCWSFILHSSPSCHACTAVYVTPQECVDLLIGVGIIWIYFTHHRSE